MRETGQQILRIVAQGRVQGVGYRAFVAREAARLALIGWVRNRVDGTVEAVVAGDAAAIDAFVGVARRGPLAARVEALRLADAEAAALEEAGGGPGFKIAPSA